MTAVLLRDDFSRYGLGRLHVVQGGCAPEREEWEEVVERRGGVVVECFEWADLDVRMHHLYVAWRLEMITEPMYCVGMEHGKANSASSLEQAFGWAVARAAEGLFRRVGAWPNRAVVLKNGVALPEYVELKTPEGVVYPVIVQVVERGLQEGLVGVYREVEGRASTPVEG